MNSMRLMMIVLGVTLLLAGPVQAASPYLTIRETRQRQAARKEALRRQQANHPPSNWMPPYSPRDRHPLVDHRDLYPKYNHGFHARQLLQLGYPTGDIGLRGQAW